MKIDKEYLTSRIKDISAETYGDFLVRHKFLLSTPKWAFPYEIVNQLHVVMTTEDIRFVVNSRVLSLRIGGERRNSKTKPLCLIPNSMTQWRS